jgi:hypothetical protein
MTSREFCYWLQGYFEIATSNDLPKDNIIRALRHDQVLLIQKHLALVFKHEIDPSYGDEKKQEDLNKIHDTTVYRC